MTRIEFVFPQVGSELPGKELHFKLDGGTVQWWTTPFGEKGDACFDGLQEAEKFAASYAQVMGYIRTKMVMCELCKEMEISIDPKIVSCRGYDTQLVQGRWQRRIDSDKEIFLKEGMSECPTIKFFKGAGETEEVPIGGNQVLVRLKPPVPITTDVPLKVRTAEVVLPTLR